MVVGVCYMYTRMYECTYTYIFYLSDILLYHVHVQLVRQ